MARKAKEAATDARIRRILDQAEAHGGLKKLDVPYALDIDPARARPTPRFAQLELPLY